MRLAFDTSAQEQFLEITAEVRQALASLKAGDGAVHVHCRHTTAGLTVNENADPTVPRDILLALRRIVPECREYQHLEGNSSAHVKASLFGSSVIVPVRAGELQLGRWQGIFFCEFDGPRQDRSVEITFLPGFG